MKEASQKTKEAQEFFDVMGEFKPKMRENFYLAQGAYERDERVRKTAEAENGVIFSYKCGDGYHPNGSWEPRNRDTRGRNIKPKWCGSTTGWTHVESYDELLKFSVCRYCGFDNKDEVLRLVPMRARELEKNLKIDIQINQFYQTILNGLDDAKLEEKKAIQIGKAKSIPDTEK